MEKYLKIDNISDISDDKWTELASELKMDFVISRNKKRFTYYLSY